MRVFAFSLFHFIFKNFMCVWVSVYVWCVCVLVSIQVLLCAHEGQKSDSCVSLQATHTLFIVRRSFSFSWPSPSGLCCSAVSPQGGTACVHLLRTGIIITYHHNPEFLNEYQRPNFSTCACIRSTVLGFWLFVFVLNESSS